ncbi:MAG TPA: Ig-like domain-containing protein [Longimicrobium sp.]
MQLLRRYPVRTSAAVAGLAGLAILAAACTDRSDPVGPTPPGGPGGPVAPPKDPSLIQVVQCRADVRAKTVSCDPAAPQGDKAPRYLIVGGQGVFVKLTSSNVNYDSPTQAFTFDVTVQNLIPQPLGTADTTAALAPDANGVRVFFHQGPTVTSGTGTITVVGDGTDNFTATGQPFYKYSTVLTQGQISAPKTWQFNMPPSVGSFSFLLYVAAAVPYENGYVEIQGNFNVRAGLERQLTPILRTVVGTVDDDPVTYTWLSTDSTRAKVNGTGLVHGLRFGTTDIAVFSSDGRRGKKPMNVSRVRRYWTGAAGVANWENGANWLPDSVKPEPQDTAVVTDTLPVAGTPYPALFQNESIGGIEVEDLTPGGTIPSISLGSFNLTASGSVCTNSGPCAGPVVFGSASITSSSGSLVLVGVAQTMRGVFPRTNVLAAPGGTYSMNGNVTVDKRIQVQGGRITNTGFRLQQTP